MSIFTILTYAMLILVVATGVAQLPRGLARELGIRWNRRRSARRISAQSSR
ncbi:hypothetical protein [Paraliomyxa miuraensis]|uniref:hypothetical protein n=1 Tax=Paraliomyxa miuraensis TaxID=376150 RepID=UPI0022534216|nr:hypothetical protein [Paraliomyxa miuraensis]MCX4241530.1 hypothetical protein [Paraliomyxa miuraensis]